MKYITREGGATVTMMVPWDCNNNCPFCVNKKEYADMEGFSLEKILESIKLMDSITPECDFVISGGEPFADLEGLQTILNAIPSTHKIFINTTFPAFTASAVAEFPKFLIKNKDKITGVNVSRHLKRYVHECSDEMLSEILKTGVLIRINCVLYDTFSKDELMAFFDRMIKYVNKVQLRANYSNTTMENLYDIDNDEIYKILDENLEYTGSLGAYRMRCGYEFKYKDLTVEYHKTLPYSTIETENGNVLYDIIIKQTGAIMSDWNEYGIPLDVDAYKEVEFEKYQ